MFEQDKNRFDTIDRYKLNLFCVCLDCKKFQDRQKLVPHSCQAYPKQNGIPPKIWNGENANCEHFEAKHPL